MGTFPLLVARLLNGRRGRSVAFAAEWGAPVSINEGPICQVVTAQREEYTFQDMLDVARIDVMSFVALYHNGIAPNSTYAWLPTHAIEKQIKGYLLKSGVCNKDDIRKLGHGVESAWRKYCAACDFESNEIIEEYIREVSAVSTDVRYGEMAVGMNDNLLSGLIYIHTLLTHDNDNDSYRSNYYGWTEASLAQMENYMSFGAFIEIFRFYLHLMIEHRIVVSPAGTCHPHKYVGVDKLRQDRADAKCPLCCGSIEFDLDEHGVTTPYKCKVIAEYLRHRLMESMANSLFLRHTEQEFDKGAHGVSGAVCCLGKSKPRPQTSEG